MKKRDDLYLREIESRIQKIESHLNKISQTKFMKSDLHRSAVVRELEIIGEAANKLSLETREKFDTIPWAQIIGMRNRLIHEYFDVDYSIVWEVAKKEVPKLLTSIRSAILQTAPPLHRWRVCPAGYYHVRSHTRNVETSTNNPDGVTDVREHCRRNPSGKDQLYPKEMLEILSAAGKEIGSSGRIGKLDPAKYKGANDLDNVLLAWTDYWNDILNPPEPLDPNVVKALYGSESSFGSNNKSNRISNGNYARGPFQITDETRKILSDEKGELKDHYMTLDKDDVQNPSIAAAAATRWLHHKRELASRYLKREASWEEAVADYKSYLRRKAPFREQKGMMSYQDFLSKLIGSKK